MTESLDFILYYLLYYIIYFIVYFTVLYLDIVPFRYFQSGI